MAEETVVSAAAGIFDRYKTSYGNQAPQEMSLGEYLQRCKEDPLTYANPAERMLAAIGKPQLIDTNSDTRLQRIHGGGKKIAVYEPFKEFYGMERTIKQVVGFFRKASQGLEESKQVLYLLGPVGGAKSSLAECIKGLMQKHPIYILQGSPVNESPLGLFNKEEWGDELERKFGIPKRALNRAIMSPWAAKRLAEFEGDISKFRVQRVMPSILSQRAIGRTEPGDENNQDISALVGSVDIRKLEQYAQNDPDAYSYSGGLCMANQGLLEFVEMFKAPIKVLHPLLTATQDGQYKGTESIGAIPFNGIVLAHSNESEWKKFKGNKDNEAFLDRVFTVKVPYTLRVDEEVKIYQKARRDSSLADAPCAPGTLEMLAQFAVLTRLKEPANSSIYTKMRVYNGENLKDSDPSAKSVQEYAEAAGLDEGMDGVSTRWGSKTMSEVFNMNAATGGEIEANPVHMLYTLEQRIRSEQFPAETEQRYLGFIKEHLAPNYAKRLEKEIQKAYVESYTEYGQNIFDRYVERADFWIQGQELRDNDTGAVYGQKELNEMLQEIEKPAGISNPKDFRNEVVNFCLRARANNGGQNPAWTEYQKLREVIEARMFANTEEILPIISFDAKKDAKDTEKHSRYVKTMVANGYTPKQVQLVSEWYRRVARP